MDNKAIGSFIAQERKSKQLTQVDFAEKLHVSAKTVSKWGKRKRAASYRSIIRYLFYS